MPHETSESYPAGATVPPVLVSVIAACGSKDADEAKARGRESPTRRVHAHQQPPSHPVSGDDPLSAGEVRSDDQSVRGESPNGEEVGSSRSADSGEDRSAYSTHPTVPAITIPAPADATYTVDAADAAHAVSHYGQPAAAGTQRSESLVIESPTDASDGGLVRSDARVQWDSSGNDDPPRARSDHNHDHDRGNGREATMITGRPAGRRRTQSRVARARTAAARERWFQKGDAGSTADPCSPPRSSARRTQAPAEGSKARSPRKVQSFRSAARSVASGESQAPATALHVTVRTLDYDQHIAQVEGRGDHPLLHLPLSDDLQRMGADPDSDPLARLASTLDIGRLLPQGRVTVATDVAAPAQPIYESASAIPVGRRDHTAGSSRWGNLRKAIRSASGSGHTGALAAVARFAVLSKSPRAGNPLIGPDDPRRDIEDLANRARGTLAELDKAPTALLRQLQTKRVNARRHGKDAFETALSASPARGHDPVPLTSLPSHPSVSSIPPAVAVRRCHRGIAACGGPAEACGPPYARVPGAGVGSRATAISRAVS